MKFHNLASIALAVAVISACSPLSPSQQAVLEQQADRDVFCASDSQCTMRWARAVEWVQANAGYPVVTQTGTLVVTDQPAFYGSRPGITIAMEPQGYGYTRIDFAAGCGLFMPVCDPSVSDLKARFVAYVMQDKVPQ
jgi:hypothetical protein